VLSFWFHPTHCIGRLDGIHFALQSNGMTAAEDATRNKRIPALAAWLCAFVSPTAYFLLLLMVDRSHLASPPAILVASLFFLIPVVALLICGRVVWRSSKTTAQRTGWLLFTVVGMLLQFGVLLLIVMIALTAAIGYAQ
jgi:hypothetical protein